MVRFLFFWVALSSLSGIRAQVNEYTEHTGNQDLIEGMTCVNNKSFYLERLDLPYYGRLNLVGIDQTGLPFLKKQLLPGDSYPVEGQCELKRTLDKQLVCTYKASQSCDVFGGPVYFSKLDTNGNFIFTVTLPWSVGDFFQYSDSSFYLTGFGPTSNGSVISHISKSGQVVESFTATGSYFSSLSELNNGNLFLSTPTTFCELDTSWNYLQIIPANTSLSSYVQIASGIGYGLNAAGQLSLLSPNFSILSQSQLPGIVLSDFLFHNDSLYVVGSNTTTQMPYYAVLDTAFNPLVQSGNSISTIRPKALDLSANNRVSVSASSLWYTASGRSFFSLSKTGDFSVSMDIGVSTFTPIVMVEMFNGMYRGEFDVEVKNYSNQAVNGFNLNHNFWTTICPYSWQKSFDTLIPPLGSVVVKTGTLNVRGNVQGGSANHRDRICFYTSAGGNRADLNISNDVWCDSVSYEALSVAENGLTTLDVRIFPNPFLSSFNIQSQVEIKEIKVFNAFGVLVFDQAATGRELTINIQDLSKGIYFVSIETEKGTVTKKMIKN
ncbi:MAG: T9SS type A sorting domain-containing protein [Bacteroidia bacterium]|nr:T9SS type A sorting domain-containing protein [Bacteroidia bacterium]